jgi:hypothetical protein
MLRCGAQVRRDLTGRPVIYHDYTSETYIITSGSGVLTTGSTILNKKASATVSVMNGPSGNGTAGPGAYSRKVETGGADVPLAKLLLVHSERGIIAAIN